MQSIQLYFTFWRLLLKVSFNTADSGLSEELQYVDLVNIPISECKTLYGNQIVDQMVCVAGQFNEGTCIVSIKKNKCSTQFDKSNLSCKIYRTKKKAFFC